jgi:galactosyl transferase GMA12/MNN10 family
MLAHQLLRTQMKFAIVTAYNQAYEPLANLTWTSNKIPYAQKHGYDYYALTEFKLPTKLISFERTEYVVKLLESGQYDWVYVCGTDTMITNFNIQLENLVDNDYDFVIAADCLGWNNDSFLARSTDLCINWLKKVGELTEEYSTSKWLDQDAMLNTVDMMEDRIKIVPQRVMNSYDYWQYPQDYEPHVKKVDVLGNDGQWRPGDFLIHWPGLPLERRIELAKEKLDQVIQ